MKAYLLYLILMDFAKQTYCHKPDWKRTTRMELTTCERLFDTYVSETIKPQEAYSPFSFVLKIH